MAKYLAVLSEPLQRLCSMKNQMQLTAHQLETWVGVLSCYETEVVTRSCLEIGLSEDPFPDLGKVVARCERHRRTRAGITASTDKVSIGEGMLKRIADSLSLTIG